MAMLNRRQRLARLRIALKHGPRLKRKELAEYALRAAERCHV